jgi:hypothetical protein
MQWVIGMMEYWKNGLEAIRSFFKDLFYPNHQIFTGESHE